MASSLKSMLANKFSLQRIAINPRIEGVIQDDVKRNILDPNFWCKIESSFVLLKPISDEGDKLYVHEIYMKVNELWNTVLIELEKCFYLGNNRRTFRKKFMSCK